MNRPIGPHHYFLLSDYGNLIGMAKNWVLLTKFPVFSGTTQPIFLKLLSSIMMLAGRLQCHILNFDPMNHFLTNNNPEWKDCNLLGKSYTMIVEM